MKESGRRNRILKKMDRQDLRRLKKKQKQKETSVEEGDCVIFKE